TVAQTGVDSPRKIVLPAVNSFCITNLSFFLCPAVCLRIQINPQNKSEFQGISPERAFADFLFANTILHLVVINFVG
ncbi:PREDICTED: dolichyl-diphosphooligosaccharide--protein glycosyltransferase subunit DAD1, partial [Apaloderma vittatum]|uniref:dolichyl-diphosphooligosaccharide--protein glycosyltransferase subunit DAD1 n=1 Tax=Apaloderma vittatum TaxID=57397 RepID=UPI000521C97B